MSSNETDLEGYDVLPPPDLPLYIRITVGIAISIILAVGTIGNTMVTLVISFSRDMRTSTNFFLVNLSIADLLVLLLVTPTALLEVIYDPETWLLGRTMCKLVPVLEMMVCHASVLTILAISFERYYAVCSPLKANYVCTKTRAVWICATVWLAAIILTSPMYFMTLYIEVEHPNGTIEPKCYLEAGSLWADLYTVAAIVLLFLFPFAILLITYGIIAEKLTTDRSVLSAKNESARARKQGKQVVLMLGTVVFTFFLCLLPFRVLTLVAVVTEYGEVLQSHSATYYNIIYFCRLMVYANSALNPILYNIMSSKFRNGFLRLCGRRRKQFIFHRNGTFLTLTTTTSPNNPVNINNNANNSVMTNSTSVSPELNHSLIRQNGHRKLHQHSFYKYSHKSGTGGLSNHQKNGTGNQRSSSLRLINVSSKARDTKILNNSKKFKYFTGQDCHNGIESNL